MFKIGRTSLIDEYRKQSRWQSLQDESQITCESQELSLLFEVDKVEAFNRALGSIPFLQREALVLQQEGFRLREISLITDCEIETVKTRIRYAKLQLKTLLQTEDGSDD